ncbi:MAG: radical SAM family heme chaperone HemW [Phycisphaerales bacterium]|nr:radical SAM family heme chaperone HemW [Phycisphaerales bacterium]
MDRNQKELSRQSPVGSIYVHVPFCYALCGYCDFYKELYDRQSVSPLVDALLSELRREAAEHALRIMTIFVGGGTPTTLPIPELSRLLGALRDTVDLALREALEFTVEANPATVTTEVAATLVASGVNRVSIGAQSFQPGELLVLERTHQPPQVRQTIETCRAAGIDNINLDLIFGVPGQAIAGWRENLARTIELGPDHISAYALTYEHGTRLTRQLNAGRVQRCDPELEADMYSATIEDLSAAGYSQYEISNFARPGRECRHNLAYWRNEQYLGIGPSAAGYVAGERYKNVPNSAQYIEAIAGGRLPRIEREVLPPDQRAREAAMLALRLNEGLIFAEFAARHGQRAQDIFAHAIEKHVSLGLLRVEEGALRLTPTGRFVADSVVADFLA